MKTIKQLSVKLSVLAIFAFFFIACEEDTNDEIQIDGIYVVNEGQFNNNNGSISLLDPETNAVQENYFKTQNDRDLGDIVQDLSFSDTKGFIVVNNSKKMEIVDKETFETIDVIGDLSYPRQFLAVSSTKGYLTNGTSADGSNGHVYVIDLEEYVITDTIEAGKGPESMVQLDERVFVTNAGGWSTGNTVTVIETTTDEVLTTIDVQAVPSDIVKDKNNDIWVYCKSQYNMNTYNYPNAQLIKIDASSYETTVFTIGAISAYGNYLLAADKHGENIYYVGSNGVYKINIADTELPANPVINRIPYGLDVNPVNNDVYCLKSSAQSKGYAFRYDKDHNLLDSAQVGYGPNAIVFE